MGSLAFDSCNSVPCRPGAAWSPSWSNHDPLDVPQGLQDTQTHPQQSGSLLPVSVYPNLGTSLWRVPESGAELSSWHRESLGSPPPPASCLLAQTEAASIIPASTLSSSNPW